MVALLPFENTHYTLRFQTRVCLWEVMWYNSKDTGLRGRNHVNSTPCHLWAISLREQYLSQLKDKNARMRLTCFVGRSGQKVSPFTKMRKTRGGAGLCGLGGGRDNGNSAFLFSTRNFEILFRHPNGDCQVGYQVYTLGVQMRG